MLSPKQVLRSIIVLFLFTALSGCMVGPDYQRPEIAAPTEWRITPSQAAESANLEWWSEFKDEELNKLIKLSLEGNLDLVRATAAVQEFYARYGVSRSELFPQLGAAGSYERFRNSELTKPPSSGNVADNFAVGLGLAWELDFWGRIRRSNEAAWAQILAEEANRRAVLVSLVSAVASTYLELRGLDAQLEVAKDTLKSRIKSVELMKDRFQAGVISELDVRQAESEVLVAQAVIPALDQAIAARENSLSVLLGQHPRAIARGKGIAELSKMQSVPGDLPALVLEQRPDIVSAEQRLIAANARIGAARAAYFPSISLTGSFGYVSSDIEHWFENPGQAWGFGPEISLPIFTAGRIAGQVEVSEAQKLQALASYKQTILNALREANDALIGYQKTGEREGYIAKQVEVLHIYLSLSRDRYDEGQVSFLEVLDAERRYFESQLSHVSSQNDRAQQVVQVFRSFGGGWIAKADEMTVAGSTAMPEATP